MLSAIIPLKKHSIRVPNKNFRKFANTTLLDIKINNLLSLKLIDNIIINSESDEVLDFVKNRYKSNKIELVKRDEYYASSECSGSEFFKNIAENAKSEILIYSPITSPFLSNDTLVKAINIYLKEDYDSVVSVFPLKHHMWFDGKPLNYDVENSPNSQDLKSPYKVTYGFGILDRELMIKRKNIIGYNPYFYKLDEIEAVDIDTEMDFSYAEFLYSKMISNKNKSTSKPQEVNSVQKKDRFQARTGHVPTIKKPETPEKFRIPYVKEENVDYDVIIIMSSFDRYLKTKNILQQIHEQSTKYKYKFILYNDRSTDVRYDSIKNDYPDIEYIEGLSNNGKAKYWQTITTLFQAAKKYKAHCICQIDDDFILCKNFINSLLDEFFYIKQISNKYVSVYYHRTSDIVNESIDIHRIDGGVLFDYKFIDHIGFEVKETKISEISSGVWKYLSNQIKNNECLSYRLNYSLIKHDGNDDSKMHKKHRDESPIISFRFKDDII